MATPPLLTAPPALQPGDAISLIAPASPPNADACAEAIKKLAAAGYEPRTYRDLCARDGYLAGSDEARVAELNEALADPETHMVLAVRGGYGAPRLLDRIDFSLLKDRPKIVCGYSDITALHSAIQSQCGLISFHSPNLMGGLGDDSTATEVEREAFYSLATGALGEGDYLSQAQSLNQARTLQGGVAQGRLVGGNFAVFMGLIGSPYAPDLTDSVLFLEDTGEAPYRFDRMFTQLRLSGALGSVAGVVCGHLTECTDEEGPSIDEVLEEFLKPLGVPVLTGFPAGHEHPNLPLPMGALVEIDATAKTLRLAQAVVSK